MTGRSGIEAASDAAGAFGDPTVPTAGVGADLRYRPLIEVISETGLLGLPVEKTVTRVAETARKVGLPVARLHVSITQIHPQFESFSRTWCATTGLEIAEHEWGARFSPAFQASPIARFLAETTSALGNDPDAAFDAWTRYRLCEAEGCADFPILREFREAGLTDYVLMACPFLEDGAPMPGEDLRQRGAVVSWCADAPGGFRDADVALIRAVQRTLGLALRSAMQRRVRDVLLATYLGADAGRRVLNGVVRRGEALHVDATILLADLRGFTALAAHLPAPDLTRTLDAYLEAMAEPVADRGGEVLKFLGDGLLAVFRQTGAEGAAAGYAAACAARDRVAGLNARLSGEGAPILSLDQALHAGEVLYGNVGAANRLDFTVIGPAVNEVSRMEQLCGRGVESDLIVSDRVARLLPATAGLTDAGSFDLRDIDGPRRLWRG